MTFSIACFVLTTRRGGPGGVTYRLAAPARFGGSADLLALPGGDADYIIRRTGLPTQWPACFPARMPPAITQGCWPLHISAPLVPPLSVFYHGATKGGTVRSDRSRLVGPLIINPVTSDSASLRTPASCRPVGALSGGPSRMSDGSGEDVQQDIGRVLRRMREQGGAPPVDVLVYLGRTVGRGASGLDVLSAFIFAILQVLVCTAVPLVVYAVTHRRVTGSRKSIGLYRPEPRSLWLALGLACVISPLMLWMLSAPGLREMAAAPTTVSGQLRQMGEPASRACVDGPGQCLPSARGVGLVPVTGASDRDLPHIPPRS